MVLPVTCPPETHPIVISEGTSGNQRDTSGVKGTNLLMGSSLVVGLEGGEN